MNNDKDILFYAIKEFQDVADNLQVETYCLDNHRITKEEYKRSQRSVSELEQKETELAKEIAYAIYRILNNKGKIWVE